MLNTRQRKPKGQERMYTCNTEHMTQNEDKQNETHNTKS